MTTIFSLSPFYAAHVCLPTADSNVPPQICNNPKFWSFFKDCLSAIDGSHIHSAPPASKWALCRNCKGFTSQNCLFICSFSLQFLYTLRLTGWEGSTTDAWIYEDACAHDLHIPAGKYYLADAGFSQCPELLVPYRGVQYYLAEWGHASVRCMSYYILVYIAEIIQDHGIKKNYLIFIMHHYKMLLSAYLVFWNGVFRFWSLRPSTI